MHINSDRLIEALTQVELLHIEQCTQCKIERQKLMALKLSANQIDIIEPPSEIWQGLNEKKNKRGQKPSSSTQWIFATAASLLLFAATWLVFNNYQLQSQLEQVLLVNQHLELQMYQQSGITFQQAQLLTEIRDIEKLLELATSTKEKLRLLKLREQLMNSMVNPQQGNKDEISI